MNRRGGFSSLTVTFCAALAGAVSICGVGCTLLWWSQSDPEGLPCELDADGVGKCLEGYACVTRSSDELPVCLKSAARREGEECEVSDQCQDGLTCASAYAYCTAEEDDPNCSLIDDEEKVLRCRPTCVLGDPSKTCGPDERCFIGAENESDFCQRGVCGADSDCQVGGDGRYCIDEGRNPGTSGVCFETCDPLSCVAGSCPDCTGLDGTPDPNRNCVPAIDELQPTNRTMCYDAGGVPALASCDPFGEPCVFGAFCNTSLVTFTPYCAQWCLFPSGNPACDGNARCEQAFGDVGFCVPN